MGAAASIADGMVVGLHFTLRDDQGQELDSSRGADPLLYLHGAGNIVPGLERQLLGRAPGDKFVAVISPEDGFGERSDEEPQAVPRAAFPPDLELEAGMPLAVEGEEGPMPVWVVSAEEDVVYLDTNHPLAGVTLHFDVEIVTVRQATDEERAHGHPHGDDGHSGH